MSDREKEKRVPNIRFKGYTDDWIKEKLLNLYSFSNGINTAKKNYGIGRKMISVIDILSTNYLYYEYIVNSVNVSESIENNNKVEKGDLVFVRSSETKKEVGWVKAYRDNKYALFSGFSIRGTKETNFNSYFVELSLNYRNRKQIESKANGSTRFNIGQKSLQNIGILYPEIKEQNSISRIIESIDSIITLEQEKINLLSKMKSVCLREMFPSNAASEPKLRFNEFKDNWNVVSLGSQTDITTGKLNANAKIKNGKYPFFTCAKETYETDTYSYDGESLLIAGNGEIGLVKYYDGKFDAYQRTYVLSNILPKAKFLQYYLNRFLPERIYVMTYGSTMPYITMSTLTDMKLKLPSEKEQQRIGQFLKNIDDKIILKKNQLKKYKNVKKLLLQNLFI